jgi:hypothetical protein
MEHKKWSVPKSLIRNPLLLIGLGVVWAICVNLLIGKWLLTAIKPELAEYYYVYIVSLVYYWFLAYINFFAKILIAWNYSIANWVLSIFSVLLLISVYTVWNSSLSYFIYCFTANWLLCCWVLGYIFYRKQRQWK